MRLHLILTLLVAAISWTARCEEESHDSAPAEVNMDQEHIAVAQAGTDQLEAEAQHLAAETVEAELVAAKEAEEAKQAERVAAEKAEAERVAAEEAEAERVAAEKAEAARIAAEKAEAERVAFEKAEAKRIAAEKAEAERVAAEKAEAERVAAEKREAEAAEARRLEEEDRQRREKIFLLAEADRARAHAEWVAARWADAMLFAVMLVVLAGFYGAFFAYYLCLVSISMVLASLGWWQMLLLKILTVGSVVGLGYFFSDEMWYWVVAAMIVTAIAALSPYGPSRKMKKVKKA